MGIWMLVRWAVQTAPVRVVGIVHAGTEVGRAKTFILMTKPKIVCYFLTHY